MLVHADQLHLDHVASMNAKTAILDDEKSRICLLCVVEAAGSIMAHNVCRNVIMCSLSLALLCIHQFHHMHA